MDFQAFDRRFSESLDKKHGRERFLPNQSLEVIRPACLCLTIACPAFNAADGYGGRLRPVPDVVTLSETLLGHTGWLSSTVLYGIHGPWGITPARGTVVPLINDP